VPTPGLLELLIAGLPVVVVVLIVKLVERTRKPPGQEARAADDERPTGWR